MSPRSVSVGLLLQSWLFCVLASIVTSEFISRGSKTDFVCNSFQSKNGWTEPILNRIDDHHKEDPINLYVGAAPRPVIDADWSVETIENPENPKNASYHYHLKNIGFEDAGIYL